MQNDGGQEAKREIVAQTFTTTGGSPALKAFVSESEGQSRASDKGGTMSKLSLCRAICLVTVFFALGVIGAPAQTASIGRAQGGTGPRPDVEGILSPAPIFTTLFTFGNADGGTPLAGLVQGTDGNLYGTTAGGGVNSSGICAGYGGDCGTVFRITAAGALTTLYNFCAQTNCTDGAAPNAALVQASDGNFYGTTLYGGGNKNCGYGSCGTAFRMTPGGELTTLYSFCSQTTGLPAGECSDGFFPQGLVQATDGNFYGMTMGGGFYGESWYGGGTIFRITPAGALTTLYDFCSQPGCTDGNDPSGGLVQATDGNLYGTTWDGGANGVGTVFMITPGGTLTTLHSFDGSDGDYPSSGVVQGTDGNFYGTTARGDTIFKMTPWGKLTTLGGACCYLYSGLVRASDGNFYGTTYVGGANNNPDCQGNGCGSLFEITPAGTLTTLYNLCSQTSCADGAMPLAGLVQATNGNLYGTTIGGALNDCQWDYWGCGTVFSLDVGLGPFVKTLPTSGPVGTPVVILGNNLEDATAFSFNGTAATFTVVSDTEIETTVPGEATTGEVQVTTFTDTLTSNVPFQVTKPCVTGPGCMLPMGR
jgi:uncharacterized repeat protein (TIGR03803 family)